MNDSGKVVITILIGLAAYCLYIALILVKGMSVIVKGLS